MMGKSALEIIELIRRNQEISAKEIFEGISNALVFPTFFVFIKSSLINSSNQKLPKYVLMMALAFLWNFGSNSKKFNFGHKISNDENKNSYPFIGHFICFMRQNSHTIHRPGDDYSQ
jgi:hypothetical protein